MMEDADSPDSPASTPFLNTSQELSAIAARDYLQSRDCATPLPPFRAEGGTTYLYYNPGKEEDWKADGYRWFQNGRKLLPSSGPVVVKTYYLLLVEGTDAPAKCKEFRKVVYHLCNDQKGTHGTLVQYLGTVPERGTLFPHGNNKKERPHIRTAPSVLKEAGRDTRDPTLHYKEKTANGEIPTTHEATLKPRNPRQVKNAQAARRHEQRYTQDELYNLVEVALDIPDFVQRMFLVPELGVVLAHRAMLQEMRGVLSVGEAQPQLLSYDTTYNLGDFYVSPLLFRHTLLEGAPVMPAAFLIHEKRTQFAHEVLMTFMAAEVPEISRAPLVTDGEDNIIKAINKCLPDMKSLRCWNHLLSAARHWLRKHGATTAECSVYSQDIKQLLMSSSQDVYKQEHMKLSGRWSQAFVQYYDAHVEPEVLSTCGRWILEPLCIYNGYSGVTTNQSEGFNTLIKQLTMRKERSVDSLALALYFLQCYYRNEVQRGLAGLGQYSLLSQFQGLAISTEEMELESCYPPAEIVERMSHVRVGMGSDGIKEADEEKGDPEETLRPPQGSPHSTLQRVEMDDSEVSTDEGVKLMHNVPDCPKVPGSQIARAQLIIDKHQCVYDPTVKAFLVQGTSQAHAVKLFPKNSCTCPAKRECYHIIAAKLYMGIDVGKMQKRITMTQLRRNTRPKCSKRRGRKGPLAEDEVEAAPDARDKEAAPDARPDTRDKEAAPDARDIIQEKNSPPPSPSLMSPAATPQQMSPVLLQSPLLTPVREAREVLAATPQQTSTPAIPQKPTTVLPQQTRSKTSRNSKVARRLFLKEEHLMAVQCGDKLSDIHITTAQQLIQNEFPDLNGCQDPLLSQMDRFVPTTEGVQIHFIHGHWVTSSSIGGDIVVYDSLYSGKLSADLSHQLAQVYKVKAIPGEGANHIEPRLRVNIPTIPQQEGSSDCGVFAIAYAYHAARKDDIGGIVFRQETMRRHLLKCFRQGKMSPFPRDGYRPKFSHQRKPKTIKLYCTCLMPETWGDMVSCDSCEQWFHVKCVGLAAMPTLEEEWLCNNCA